MTGPAEELTGPAEELTGPAEELSELSLLRKVVEKHRPQPTVVVIKSSVDHVQQKIPDLSEDGLGVQAIYDWLRLEDTDFKASSCALRH